jgi:hypothetical protein
MIRMIRHALAGLLMSTFLMSVSADTPPSPEALSLARRFLSLTGQGATFNGIRQQKLKQFEQRIVSNTNLTDSAKADLGRIPAVMNDALSWQNIEEPLAAEYARLFSEQELMQLIEFYESPVVKKLLAETPILEMKKREIILRLSAEAAAESANANAEPTQVLIPSATSMQTVTVGNATISADDVLKEMKKWEK